MSGEARRRRLSELARQRGGGPGQGGPGGAAPREGASGEGASGGAAAGSGPGRRGPASGSAPRGSLESLVPGVAEATPHGRHWRHERVLAEDPGLARAAAALAPGRLPELDGVRRDRPLEDALFLDLETCGFAGNPLFLSGLLRVEGDRVVLIQLLARTYAEEASVAAATMALLERHPLLVTFNGKAYDVPFLRERVIRHGLPWREPEAHLDLLHAARRRWRDVLPDCRLTTLETRFTGRRRSGDVPGSEVPARYHAFVKEGAAAGLVPVLRHNLLDLLTLVALLGALPGKENP